MCLFDYYNLNRGTVYCVMLDASKAFDRVQYCRLFRKLISRKLPAVIIRFLLNMYTHHRTHVLWNGSASHWFNVSNGVKQGGVLVSPILFYVYIDGLLISLCRAGLGCHIGHMLVGVDDFVLLAPTPHAMRLMLQFCEEYAKDHDVLFNADKSKCVISRPHGVASGGNLNHDICFSISGNVIENVESWPHLGHVITNNASDKLDVLSCRGSFIGQVNNVICRFSKLDEDEDEATEGVLFQLLWL